MFPVGNVAQSGGRGSRWRKVPKAVSILVMSGGVAGRMGLQLALSLILLACNTFDPPDGDPPGDPGVEDMEAGFAPTAGFGGFFGRAAWEVCRRHRHRP